MTYVWKKRFFLQEAHLNKEWISSDRKIALIPDKSQIGSRDRNYVRGYCIVNYDDYGDGYKDFAIDVVESLFACYLLMDMQNFDISYYVEDELVNVDELVKKRIPIPPRGVGPIDLKLQAYLKDFILNDAYAFLNKIFHHNFSDQLKKSLNWFFNSSLSETDIDKFITLWIAFEVLFSTKYFDDKNKHSNRVADELDHLVTNLYNNNLAQLFLNDLVVNRFRIFIYTNCKGIFYSGSRKDYVINSENEYNKGEYRESLKLLIRSVYNLRKKIFHEGDFYKRNNQILSNYVHLLRSFYIKSMQLYIT